MIEIKNLTKIYKDKVAVDNLSLDIKPGVVTGFLGPNGAGKSTTMRMILNQYFHSLFEQSFVSISLQIFDLAHFQD